MRAAPYLVEVEPPINLREDPWADIVEWLNNHGVRLTKILKKLGGGGERSMNKEEIEKMVANMDEKTMLMFMNAIVEKRYKRGSYLANAINLVWSPGSIPDL